MLVPALVGLTLIDAHAPALRARLVLASADPTRPLPIAGVVVDQQPAAGLKPDPADTVRVVVDEGGHDRAPVPTPRRARGAVLTDRSATGPRSTLHS
ncbi:PASTA domain-containing protein [Pseudonocardia lacus]|uniref:PASTA domain-containing protein n=1 Tax=Pseudonocardia lacus TaxID=2835865 RepID=UPI001BDCA44A|nr:PASTA domain-containing protein [Pseudonocardia lacus]